MDRLHLLNSLTGLVLLYVSSNLPFTIFLLRGFFEAIPREYEESIRMDGAGTLRVLWNLIAPLSLPALAVVSMFIFSAAWDEFPIAVTMISSSNNYTLPVGLGRLHRRAHRCLGAVLCGLGDRDGPGRRRVSHFFEMVPFRSVPWSDSITQWGYVNTNSCGKTRSRDARSTRVDRSRIGKDVDVPANVEVEDAFKDLRSFYRVGEVIEIAALPSELRG